MIIFITNIMSHGVYSLEQQVSRHNIDLRFFFFLIIRFGRFSGKQMLVFMTLKLFDCGVQKPLYLRYGIDGKWNMKCFQSRQRRFLNELNTEHQERSIYNQKPLQRAAVLELWQDGKWNMQI
jgi:hypothetical protein